MSSERAAVAREVLTDMLCGMGAEAWDGVRVIEYMDKHYPAPPAPETVTVGKKTYHKRGSVWCLHDNVNMPYSYEFGDLCDRIASDARELAEKDKRIAESEQERDTEREIRNSLARLLDDEKRKAQREASTADWLRGELQKIRALVANEDGYDAEEGVVDNVIAVVTRQAMRELALTEERDAARREVEEVKRDAVRVARGCRDYGGGYRSNETLLNAFHHGIDTVGSALEAWASDANDTQVQALRYSSGSATGDSTGTPFNATSQGDGLAQAGPDSGKANSEGNPSGTSPAPIPLGATRRWWLVIDSDGNVSVANSLTTAREWAETWAAADKMAYSVVPVIEAVAARETVERVYDALARDETGRRVYWWGKARAALRAAGFTLEGA